MACNPQQFVVLSRPQQLLLAGYLEPYDEIPNLDDADLAILKSARVGLVDSKTFGALMDWRPDLLDLLRDEYAIGAGLR